MPLGPVSFLQHNYFKTPPYCGCERTPFLSAAEKYFTYSDITLCPFTH